MITCERCTVRPAAVVRAYTYSGRWHVCHPCAMHLDRYHARLPATLPMVDNPALPLRLWDNRRRHQVRTDAVERTRKVGRAS